MNKHKSLKSTQSLLERASELYGFDGVMRGKPAVKVETAEPAKISDTLDSNRTEVASQSVRQNAADKLPVTEKLSLEDKISLSDKGVNAPSEPAVKAVPVTAPVTAPEPIAKAPEPIKSKPLSSGASVSEPSVIAPSVAPSVSGPASQKAINSENVETSKPISADKLYRNKEVRKIDRQWLSDNNLLIPDGPVTALSEEFRIVKRQLLLAARGGKGVEAVEHGERILICSANPNEGKTYTSINLALSMASEKDNRVLLIDADFAKPSILSTLNIEGGPGLMDALADPSLDVNQMVLNTDVEGLSILPAGSQSNQDTEYLAAARTAKLIEKLSVDDPSRIIIFDSPPALAASPASVLALHVGQTLMVVHADKTTDSALRDALNLLSGCDHVQLLLNRANFSPSGRKFGSYYGYGA